MSYFLTKNTPVLTLSSLHLPFPIKSTSAPHTSQRDFPGAEPAGVGLLDRRRRKIPGFGVEGRSRLPLHRRNRRSTRIYIPLAGGKISGIGVEGRSPPPLHRQSSTFCSVWHGIEMEDSESLIIIPQVSEDYTPSKGKEFASDSVAYAFYNDYARRAYFGIRKEYGNKCRKTKVLTSRRYVCDREGIRGKDGRDHKTNRTRAESRCGCDARMTIILNRDTKMKKIREAREPDNFTEETTLNPTRNLAPIDPPSLTYTARGIKKKQNTRCKKRRPKTWIERMKKPRGDVKSNNYNSENQTIGEVAVLNFTDLLFKEMQRRE